MLPPGFRASGLPGFRASGLPGSRVQPRIRHSDAKLTSCIG